MIFVIAALSWSFKKLISDCSGDMTLFFCLGLVTLAVACEEHAVVLDTGVGMEVFDEVTGIDIKTADVVDVEGLDDAAVEVAGGTFKVFEELLEKNTASGGNW